MAAHSHSNLSIVEAVEMLSTIADLEFDREVGIAQKHEVMIGNEKIAYKTVHWLHKGDAPSTVNLVRETFRVILHYLRQFYRKEYQNVTDENTLEGIKTIMVLVGEAAKKLDKYTQFFHQTQSVTDFREYQQLQEFYRTKIARKIEEGVITKWLSGISLGKQAPEKIVLKAAPAKSEKGLETAKHVFVDFESVKRDTEYELFFIRKEDGSRFFSSRVLRNIKLVCDFGGYFGERRALDPLEHIKEWHDRVLHTCAREILKVLGHRLTHFFRELRLVKNQELVEVLNKALMALMLSSHAQNLLRHHPVKSCAEYFDDFQNFLREALQTKIYQRWLAYPPQESNKLAFDLMDIVQTLCRAVYCNLKGLEDIVPVIQNLMAHAEQAVSREQIQDAEGLKNIWKRLGSDYVAMTKLLKHHPNGPMYKILDILEEDAFHIFDTILQHNIPNQLFDMHADDHRYSFLRIGAPVVQEFINKASINEEFKAFIHSYAQGSISRKHLLINLQDRTSWREHARCVALEEFEHHQPELEKALTVVTLPTDTEFYHQVNPYHQVHQAATFMEQFKEHLMGDHSGYYFPPCINKEELGLFIDGALPVIHHIFFSNKNVLPREQRMEFIELFYLFLQLKLIEWVQPDSISLTCKDGVDTGMAYSSELFAFLKLINNQEWTENDWLHLNFMIYAPALLIRERVMLPDRFHRMLGALKIVQNARDEFGDDNFVKIIQEGFVMLYKTPVLQSSLHLPR